MLSSQHAIKADVLFDLLAFMIVIITTIVLYYSGDYYNTSIIN